MTKAYNRETKKIEEIKHFGKKGLKIIYNSKILTKIFTSRLISNIYGLYNKSSVSKYRIKKFVIENNIDLSLFEEKKYKNYNEFFIRKYKELDINQKDFISPCDAKLLVYKIDENLKVKVKDFTYTVKELFGKEINNLNGSYMFIYRLAVNDCHRYYYIDDGKTEERLHIKGKFHTVSDSSYKYKIYKENEREYSVLNTKKFGKVIYMEVGAMMIGKIVNHDKPTFKRGEEKGYFLPGASTIIVVAKDIEVDSDILQNSKNNLETLVHIGERVGTKRKDI